MSEASPDCYIGIDTSNYTTSVGIYSVNGKYINSRKILPVPDGECGLRQSNALFEHVRQFAEVFAAAGTSSFNIKGIGVSTRPRNIEGSYMPCFLYGQSAAETLAAAYSVPVTKFSHQQGHIAAGILSSGHTELFDGPFYAFHASGGTTELLLVENIDSISIAAKTLDISVGQLVDRTGIMLGLHFPCGKELEALAANGKSPERPRVKLKDGDCCLSGYENKIKKMICDGVSAADVSKYTLDVVGDVISRMISSVNTDRLPVLCVGGVMSDMIVRRAVIDGCGTDNVFFASADLSSDNAVGIAYLAYRGSYEQ